MALAVAVGEHAIGRSALNSPALGCEVRQLLGAAMRATYSWAVICTCRAGPRLDNHRQRNHVNAELFWARAGEMSDVESVMMAKT